MSNVEAIGVHVKFEAGGKVARVSVVNLVMALTTGIVLIQAVGIFVQVHSPSQLIAQFLSHCWTPAPARDCMARTLSPNLTILQQPERETSLLDNNHTHCHTLYLPPPRAPSPPQH